MEEKIYELMEKMYGQMQNGFAELRGEMQHGFSELRGEINGLKEGQGKLEKGQVKLKNELKEAKSALFDG